MDKKIVMKRRYDNIKDVNESKDVWMFVVRVVDVWPVMGKFIQEQLDMVVVDKQVSYYRLLLTCLHIYINLKH